MEELIEMQTERCSDLDPGKLCSFDLEVIDAPTAPLIHQSARFLLINSGRGKIRIQNVDYCLASGSWVAISPWQISEVVEVEEPLQYFIVAYRFDMVSQVIKSLYNTAGDSLEAESLLASHPVVHCGAARYGNIKDMFWSIRDEVGTESTMTEARPRYMGGVYTLNLLVALVTLYLRTVKDDADLADSPGSAPDRSEIFRYMYNHLSEKLTLKLLSQIFYLSESAISQYITRVTGLSFFDLLGEMRVGKTITFLLYTDLTLDELAEILGYVDAAHISKVFSARIGMRANEYRKTYQRVGEFCRVKESAKAYNVISYLYRNYAEDLTPGKVAGQFGISVKELQRILLYQVERGFEDFLNMIRINRASGLLLETDRPIVDIAAEVGYHSTKTFTRNFLKLRVMTPSAFRRSVGLQPKFNRNEEIL